MSIELTPYHSVFRPSLHFSNFVLGLLPSVQILYLFTLGCTVRQQFPALTSSMDRMLHFIACIHVKRCWKFTLVVLVNACPPYEVPTHELDHRLSICGGIRVELINACDYRAQIPRRSSSITISTSRVTSPDRRIFRRVLQVSRVNRSARLSLELSQRVLLDPLLIVSLTFSDSP